MVQLKTDLVEAVHCKYVRLGVDMMDAGAWAGEAKSGAASIFTNADHVLVQPVGGDKRQGG